MALSLGLTPVPSAYLSRPCINTTFWPMSPLQKFSWDFYLKHTEFTDEYGENWYRAPWSHQWTECVALHLFKCSFILADSFYDILYKSFTYLFCCLLRLLLFLNVLEKDIFRKLLFLFLAIDTSKAIQLCMCIVYPAIMPNSCQIQGLVILF